MGRNYRFFSNLKVQMRRKLSKELEQWKARNEAAAASRANKQNNSASLASQPDSKELEALTAEDKELAEVSRFNSIIQSQLVLQQ